VTELFYCDREREREADLETRGANGYAVKDINDLPMGREARGGPSPSKPDSWISLSVRAKVKHSTQTVDGMPITSLLLVSDKLFLDYFRCS